MVLLKSTRTGYAVYIYSLSFVTDSQGIDLSIF